MGISVGRLRSPAGAGEGAGSGAGARRMLLRRRLSTALAARRIFDAEMAVTAAHRATGDGVSRAGCRCG
jgi:hypothetical protein